MDWDKGYAHQCICLIFFLPETHTIDVSFSLANTVKNKDAFMVLHNAFLRGQTSHIGNDIIDAMINIYKYDPANFFILEPVHSLSSFLEVLVEKNQDVQVRVIS